MRTHILGEIGRPVVVCETDLDVWLFQQEAGDIITAAALGSSGGKPDSGLAVYLLAAPRILVALDADEAGMNGSDGGWRNFLMQSYGLLYHGVKTLGMRLGRIHACCSVGSLSDSTMNPTVATLTICGMFPPVGIQFAASAFRNL